MRGHYQPVEGSYASGSKYKPLQTDGFDILCPDCGGYATVPHKGQQVECSFCSGKGHISLEDPRVKGMDHA